MKLSPEQLLEDLYQAYYDARKNKRNKINQLRFELNLEQNLLQIHRQLIDRTWEPGTSVAFIVERPVKREVFAASFADRVIHHLFFNYTNEIFERSFIHDSYSCRKGKGTLYGIRRLDHHIRSASHNYSRDAYILKLDLAGYFMSINRTLLLEKVTSTLMKYAPRWNSAHERFGNALDYDLILFLAHRICLHDPVRNCFFEGDKNKWQGLPADKSLFGTSPDCGLPIGNLTSQLFSNVYLNEFDNWAKRSLGAQHYGRYVDDFYIVHPSTDFLFAAGPDIGNVLRKRIGIRLHPRKIYQQHFSRGTTFLGAIVKPYRIYAASRIVANLCEMLSDFIAASPATSRSPGSRSATSRSPGSRSATSRSPGSRSATSRSPGLRISPAVDLRQSLNSYLGLMLHFRTFGLRRRIVDGRHWMFDLGWLDTHLRRFRIDNLCTTQQGAGR